MPNFPYGAIDVVNAAGAQQAAARVASAAELAVDVEADAMHAFRARLCFVQVSTGAEIFLFDTLVPDVDIRLVAEPFADPARTKFFHAAGGDLQYLADEGVRVRGLFDTHRAATLLGWPKVGLADLVRERLGVELKKEHQQSDFSIRPLPPGMRDYISDDVRYLVEIGQQVRRACQDADILEEVLLDCDRMAEEAVARPNEGADFRPKLPRNQLKPAQFVLATAISHRLHAMRLKWAEAANVPMGRMLSNAAIQAIAVRPPQDVKTLSRLEGVRGPFAREHGEEVLQTIRELIEQHRQGLLTVEDDDERSPKDPNRRKRAEALKEWRTTKSRERKVTPSVVLPNALVDDLVTSTPESVDDLRKLQWFGEKRVRLYGEELVALLAPLR